jgi:MYXO-CTERM domain-containing protein
VPNLQDNCPNIPNRDQLDTNSLNGGNVCDSDDDGDGILDTLDVCPLLPNPGNVQLNDPRCNADADGDNISDSFDNCIGSVNATQLDTDLDGIGDVCDLDIDNDGILNIADNCSGIRNRTQLDDDGDALGDACDAKYCVVVDPSNKEDCLDPNGPFRVHAGGLVMLKAGEKFRLPLFANRNGAAIEYTWTVKARPSSSKAAVVNPQGVVTMSRHWEYAYQDGQVPSFTADVDGEYDIQLQAKLAFADRAYPENRDSTSSLKLNASPDGKNGAQTCSAIPVDASLAALGLGLLALARRRRS